MNCFMGYNPLVTKQVKVTVWVCEQDGATPVAPSNPSAGDCFIVYATDEAVLSNTPTSAKTYTNGEWADAEGGGGGLTFPTFTASDGHISCDMTYSEAEANCVENADEDGAGIGKWVYNGEHWISLWVVGREDIDTAFKNVPETVDEGLAIVSCVTDKPYALFAEDGNYYEPKN